TDTVARFGGDEFVIALTPLQSRDECHAILRRVEKAIAEPIVLTEQRIVRISASLGIAFCPEDGATPEALLAHADRAMYNAKRATSAA
ncbi:MAG TPA: GGDEF domain-containing protein, partial [Steroidobacteraceae bacterium]|nr:GGDEF domain-containing protein [Steroidobacteraceae bacterium]